MRNFYNVFVSRKIDAIQKILEHKSLKNKIFAAILSPLKNVFFAKKKYIKILFFALGRGYGEFWPKNPVFFFL